MEAIGLLGLCLVHEALVDGVARVNDPVGLVLNGSLLLLGQRLVVGDIQVSHLGSFLGSILPNVGTEHLAARSEDDMGSSVMGLELSSSLGIDHDMGLLALDVALDWLVKGVEHNLADLDGVDDLELLLGALKGDNTIVMLLTSRCWVNCRLVQDEEVWNVLLQHVVEDVENLGIELHHLVVLIEEIIGLLQVSGVVEDGLSSLGSSLLSHGDLVVKSLWDWSLDDLGDQIGWDTVRLHTNDPVVKGELTLALLDDLLELLDGLLVGESPPVVLDLDDLCETLILWEFTIDTLEVLLMVLEDLKEALHAKVVPPLGFLHDREHSSEDVSHIASTTNVRRKSSIGDGDQDSPGVIEDNIKILDWLNSSLDSLHIVANFVRDLLPSLVDVLDLIDVQGARVWTELVPDLLIDFHVQLLEHVTLGLLESVLVGGGATVDEPCDSLKADSAVDDLDGELLSGSVMESLVLHEDHVADLETSHEVLDGGAEVTSTGPDVFDEGDLIRVDAEGLSEPSEVELDDLVLKEDILVWVVENLDTQHDEAGVVATCDTNIVEVIESGTELWADQRIGWWVQLSSHAIWLEAEDTCSDEVDIISPSGDDWVSLDGLAWDPSSSETLLKSLPGFSEGDLLAILVESIANK